MSKDQPLNSAFAEAISKLSLPDTVKLCLATKEHTVMALECVKNKQVTPSDHEHLLECSNRLIALKLQANYLLTEQKYPEDLLNTLTEFNKSYDDLMLEVINALDGNIIERLHLPERGPVVAAHTDLLESRIPDFLQLPR